MPILAIRRLPVLPSRSSERPSPRPASAAESEESKVTGPVIVVGSLLILVGWGALGPWALRFGPGAALVLFAGCSALGGALVGRVAAWRPVGAAAIAGGVAALAAVVIALLGGALGDVGSLLLALSVLLVVGVGASALGGKLAARGRSRGRE